MLKAALSFRIFHFGFAARTSRGAMRERKSWFIKLWKDKETEIFGLGECGPLPGLSPENLADLESLLEATVSKINTSSWNLSEFVDRDKDLNTLWSGLNARLGLDFLQDNPSVAFALETALLDLANGGTRMIFDNSFLRGEPIPINGLVWMGGLDFMLQQVEIKIRDGFSCIKLKVGGIDFEKECDILQYIRRKYFRDVITLRLDANGAFKAEDALYKIKQIEKFGIHSIEQPLRTGAPELAELCRESPIPIALDEELIGVKGRAAKEELLSRIKPSYLILKPTLHGGLFGCNEWIEIAEEQNIAWWITSALESSVGLNAISQFTAQYPIEIPQGLGTGEIYTDNIDAPLRVKKGLLSYHRGASWDLLPFNN